MQNTSKPISTEENSVKPATEESLCRLERKFFISEWTGSEVESLIKLHPAVFSEIYGERFVNNLYFDTPDRRFYWNSLDGMPYRIKFRIRWYGELMGWVKSPTLELKIKQGAVGQKRSYSVIPFNVDHSLDRHQLQAVFRKSHLPDEVEEELAVLEPLFMNRFRRRYFQSADGVFRITVDTELEYYAIGFLGRILRKEWCCDRGTILELKYSVDKDSQADEITQHFPFRMTRNSKYVAGVERTESTLFR